MSNEINAELSPQAIIEVLDECISYIESTYGTEDDLPEPECSVRARALRGMLATQETGGSGGLPDHLETLLLQATSMAGSIDPNECLPYIEEQLTRAEFDLLGGFLFWLMNMQLTIGWGNVQAQFAEYEKQERKA
jgi:hypothetical protein